MILNKINNSKKYWVFRYVRPSVIIKIFGGIVELVSKIFRIHPPLNSGTAEWMSNHNYADIRKIAEEKYKNIACGWCGYPIKSVLQVAHVKKAKPKNNNPSNLVWLCPTHHREYDLKLISRQMILRRRKFMESFPEADWNNLFGLSKKELSARANKAWENR